MTDVHDLLERAKRGEQDAIASLFRHNYESLRADVASKAPKALNVTADDILQETFAYAWKNANALFDTDVLGVSRWLRTVARRKLIDAVRAQTAAKRGGKSASGNSVSSFVVPAPDRTPSSIAASTEATSLLKDALAKLSDRERRAITLRYLNSQSFKRAADAMEVSERAVQMLCARAIKNLKLELASSREHGNDLS